MTISRRTPPSRALRREIGRGEPLPDRVRDELERAVNADFGNVRVHADAAAADLARAVEADAFAVGSDVYFAAGAFNPGRTAGLRLLAHELVHAVQDPPAVGHGGHDLYISDVSSPREQEARRMAAMVVDAAGRLDRPTRRVAPRTDRDAPVHVHRHASFEHRLLGDALPADLDAIAKKQDGYQSLLTGQVEFLGMWAKNPESVTEAMILERYPYVMPLRVGEGDLLVTYGELNTMPDYLANLKVFEQQPKNIVLPILQAVRQEGYNRLQRLRGSRDTESFEKAVGINTGWDFIDLLYETYDVDSLTRDIGPNRTNHYSAAIGRNACHFAPFSWYRWNEFHTRARDTARQAHSADGPTRAALTKAAWTYNGFADHFLQDSFAAGHLVNKNLLMQWFVEWVSDYWYIPIADWDAVKHMTTKEQPGLAARVLYNQENLYHPDPQRVTDPQTAEEQATYQDRMRRTGVQASGGASQDTSYQRYLAWLNSTVIQSASGVLHDYFNNTSLWVASAAHPEPYQIWGDDTMLSGGDGVRLACEAAHASQRAIADLLDHGGTDITVREIADRFPSMVRNDAGVLLPLEAWQDGLRPLAAKLFPDVHYYLLRLYSTIGHVSVDQKG